MDIKPEISVIIPVHNGQEHLEKCLYSLTKQSFSDFEVLIINNGSTDNTFNIAKSFSDSDNRFTIINHNHGGAGEARNIGIENAVGKYLAFVDSDDLVLEQYLEKLHTAIISNDADVAVCGFCLYFRKSDKVVHRHCVKDTVYNRHDALKELLRDDKMRFYLWNKLWKRSLFYENDISIPDMYYEDAVACTKFFCHAKKVVMTDYCGYSYFRASSKVLKEVEMNSIRLNDYINTVPMIRSYLEKMGIYKKLKAPFSRHINHVFWSVPFLSAQARQGLERGVLKNAFAGMGKVIRSCKAPCNELDGIAQEKTIY